MPRSAVDVWSLEYLYSWLDVYRVAWRLDTLSVLLINVTVLPIKCFPLSEAKDFLTVRSGIVFASLEKKRKEHKPSYYCRYICEKNIKNNIYGGKNYLPQTNEMLHCLNVWIYVMKSLYILIT